jgi:hypothetical protein
MRIMAALVALVAAISLYAQWVVSSGVVAADGRLVVAWRMLAYFSVLSGFAAVIIMARAAITGRIGARTAGLITIMMLAGGLGYHALLAAVWKPEGVALWADHGLHTAVPLLIAVWWAAFAPKTGLRFFDALRWLVWPVLFADYAVVRGLAEGFWPYPFLNVAALGIYQVTLNIGALAAVFAVIGLLWIGIARIIR